MTAYAAGIIAPAPFAPAHPCCSGPAVSISSAAGECARAFSYLIRPSATIQNQRSGAKMDWPQSTSLAEESRGVRCALRREVEVGAGELQPPALSCGSQERKCGHLVLQRFGHDPTGEPLNSSAHRMTSYGEDRDRRSQGPHLVNAQRPSLHRRHHQSDVVSIVERRSRGRRLSASVPPRGGGPLGGWRRVWEEQASRRRGEVRAEGGWSAALQGEKSRGTSARPPRGAIAAAPRQQNPKGNDTSLSAAQGCAHCSGWGTPSGNERPEGPRRSVSV